MRRFIALTAAAVAALSIATGAAAEEITGTVLMAPAAGEVVVHHAAFGRMPAMTMSFRIAAQSRLEPGDTIRADIDRSSDPWTLANVRVLAGAAPAPARVEQPIAAVGDRVWDVRFIDQLGRPLALRSLRGTPYAIAFIYTRCSDAKMCPLVSAKFHAIQQRLARAGALVEISLDPAYDRPPILSRYGAAFGADPLRWHLLTGDPRSVLDFAAHFGILEEAAGPVKIVHSERLAIVDRDGRIVRFFDDARWSPSDVLQQLRDAAVVRTARR